MNEKLKNGLKTIGKISGSVGAATVASYLTTNYLLKMAMDREMPKAAQNAGSLISGKKTDEGFLQALKSSARKLEETPNQEIEITAHDGIKLVGHYITCEKPERIIIAMHGWRSSWYGDFGLVSDAWKKYNCNVLYVEQRGQNNSGGEYIGFGLVERYDCVSWVNWMINTYGSNLPIYLAGVSMGATTVLLSTGLNLPPEVHGVIADCGFTSPDAIWKHIATDNLHLFCGIRSHIADDIYQKRTKEPSDQYSTEDALSITDVPVLFIHGTEDHFVPVSMTYDNYKACNAPKELFVVPGADHGMSYYIEKEDYEQKVLQFWKKYDGYDRAAEQKK